MIWIEEVNDADVEEVIKELQRKVAKPNLSISSKPLVKKNTVKVKYRDRKLLKPNNANKQPLNVVPFPKVVSKTSFKIPRQKTTTTMRGAKNGSLWSSSVTLDATGQWFVTDQGRRPVPRTLKHSKRTLVAPESWLKHGVKRDFMELDDVENEGVKRRKHDASDPLGLNSDMNDVTDNVTMESTECERRSVERPLPLDHNSPLFMDRNLNFEEPTDKNHDFVEDPMRNELDDSVESMVTHIQSPTSFFIEKIDEQVSEDTGIEVDRSSPSGSGQSEAAHRTLDISSREPQDERRTPDCEEDATHPTQIPQAFQFGSSLGLPLDVASGSKSQEDSQVESCIRHLMSSRKVKFKL